MKRSALMGFMVLFLNISFTTAQTLNPPNVCATLIPTNPNPICVNASFAPNGSTVNFIRNNANNPSLASFYFFDDGYYAINNNPHGFYFGGNNTFDIEVSSARGYVPTVPQRLAGPITATFQNSAPPPFLSARKAVDFKTGWAAMADENYMFIIQYTVCTQ